MEILQISKGRLKVTLDAEELKEYEVAPIESYLDGAHLEEAFEGVLAVVGAKTGIRFEKGQTYVQVYPSRDGGCELFFVHNDVRKNKKTALVPVKEEASYLCVFENRGELVRFLALLKCYGASCRVYAQSEASGYLALVRPRGAEMLLREFGSPADKRTALYLEEHFSSVTI